MSIEIRMPALGESVTEGTVTTWLKQVGDTVEVDEPLLEVSTDKVDTEVPSPVAGVLEKIVVDEDETVDVGALLAYIGDGSGAEAPAAEAPAEPEPAPAPEPEPEPAPAPVAEPEPAPAPAAPAAPAASGPVTGGIEVRMPALGESVTEGTVTTWLKQVGDTVEVDEPLLEVSTDKVDTEVPSPVAGVLTQIVVQEDETVDVGALLAYIGGEAGAAPAPAAEAPAEPEPAPAPEPEPEPAPAPEPEPAPAPAPAPVAEPEPAPAPAAPAPLAAAASVDEGYVTPIVRKLAKELGVDLSQVKGTGVGGRIRRQDVEAAAKAPAPAAEAAPAPSAGAVAAPAQGVAVVELDLTGVGAEGAMPVLAAAAAKALAAHPALNGAEGDAHVAVTLGRIAPIVRGAQALDRAGMEKALADASKRFETGAIGPDDLFGATFAVEDAGVRDLLLEIPAVVPGHKATLSLGKVQKAPRVVTDRNGADAIAIRLTAYLALAYDSEAVHAEEAAAFLVQVRDEVLA